MQEATQGTKGQYRVVVLHSRCIGAAVCVQEALGSFKLNQKKKALVTDLTKNSINTIINAAKNCPTQAIYIYKGTTQIWPAPGADSPSMQPGRELKMSFDPPKNT